jgi:hypothetical protein
MTQAPDSPPVRSGMHPHERRVLAIGTAIVLHAAIVSVAAVLHAIVMTTGNARGLPREPLLLTVVALLLAHASLGAVWWARCDWPSYAKTLIAVLATVALWVLLMGVLQSTSITQPAAAGWAAALATQTVLAGLGAALLELRRSPEAAVDRSRFTILFLLLWTAVIALLLGAGRTLGEALGWKLADLLAWEYLYQLQFVAVSSAVLALCVLAAVQLRRHWTVRLFVAVAAVFLAAVAVPFLMSAVFRGKIGAGFADVVWLMICQGLFLLATLAPLEAARPEGQTSS